MPNIRSLFLPKPLSAARARVNALRAARAADGAVPAAPHLVVPPDMNPPEKPDPRKDLGFSLAGLGRTMLLAIAVTVVIFFYKQWS